MDYKKGEVKFKGLKFSWNLITTEKGTNGEYEVFNIEIEKDGIKIRQEFNNSIMENKISELMKLYPNYKTMDFIQFRNHLRTSVCKMWGGYDKGIDDKTKIKNFKEFNKKRIWWLLLSIITDFSNYIEFEEGFSWFCANYGYDEDSRKAEDIYKKCLDYFNKIETLKLSDEQRKYFINEVSQETNLFCHKDLNKIIEEQY